MLISPHKHHSAVVYHQDDDEGASNGGGGALKVCVGNQVHLELSWGWYDQTGDEESSYNNEYARVIGRCDGSCAQRTLGLSVAQRVLVAEFLATGKQGELSKETLMYPKAMNDDFERSKPTEEAILREQYRDNR
ncbi:MAG: hypothetical protein WCP18_03515 [bacterium]